MTSTLSDMVMAIAPTIPPPLMSSGNVETIRAVAQHFPLPLSTTVGFECSLTAPDPTADFFLRVSGAWGRSLLAGLPQSPPILTQFQKGSPFGHNTASPPDFAQLWPQSPWSNIRQIAQRWAEPTSLLHAAIDDLWLEFDRERTAALPSIFFGIKSPGLPSLDWIGKIAVPTLTGYALAAHVQTTLQDCLAAIPASARLFQVGVLSGRVSSPLDHPVLRLYIQNVALNQLPALLDRLSWPGDRALLTQLLAQLSSQNETCSLQLELQGDSNSSGSVLSPKIGIECTFPHREAWQKGLSRLVMLGFCRPDRARALLQYPGYVRAQNCEQFPPLFKQWSAQLSPYRECLLVKRLAYLKFTYEPGQLLQAKAYLGLSPTWIDSRYLNPDATDALSRSDQESTAIQVCKDLIQQLDYGEIDVDELFAYQRSQKSRWLNKALETMCVGG